MARVHLLDERVPPSQWHDGFIVAFCGVPRPSRVTEDPADMTCQLCEAAMARANRPLEESPYVVRKAKQWARARAVSVLVARHRDELEDLIAEQLPFATGEAIDAERSYRALRDKQELVGDRR